MTNNKSSKETYKKDSAIIVDMEFAIIRELRGLDDKKQQQ
jgi:hypothetical protein